METPSPSKVPARRAWKAWSQRIHIYLGLYFLVFLWLFAVSGLVLNHAWRFTQPQRQQFTREQRIAVPDAPGDLGRAQDLMRQLNLAGELDWTTTRPAAERLEFRVARPGRTIDVRADFAKQTATVQETRVNSWGVFRMLHTFTGMRPNAPRAERDWLMTKLWSFSMDALAVGMILLVLTSFVMTYGRRDKWLGAGIALGLGVAACGFFLFGLQWL